MKSAEGRQTGAVLFCALSAVGATFWTSLPPWMTIPAGAVAAVLWATSKGSASEWKPGRLRTIAWVGACLGFLGVLALATKLADLAYPSAAHPRLLGMILLAVSIRTAARDGKATLRTGAILFWFVLIMYAVIGICSTEQIKPRPILMADMGADAEGMVWALLLALLPLSVFWAEASERPGKMWHPAWLAVLILPGLLCWLTLGPIRSAQELFSLYTLSKSVSLFGIMERFEILVSAALTAGIFCMMSYTAHQILYRCKRKHIAAVGLFAVTLLLTCVGTVELGKATALLGIIFWWIVPRVGRKRRPEKKFEKTEKRC